MKTLIWTAVFLAAALPGAAQVSPPKGASHVFIANSSNSVTVKNTAGVTVATLAAGYGFSSPYDIVAVPEHDMVVVSNSGDGSLTVFNGRTFAFISDVDLSGAPLLASNLRGMSVSEDASAVFIAGEHGGNPALFRLSLPDLSPSLTGFFTDVTASAEDCVVVRASAVGGAGGNAPGRVYLSVPQATTGNYLLIFNIDPPGPMGQEFLASGAWANITNPTRLERTPDHASVFIACTTAEAASVQRIGRIQTGPTDTFSQPIMRDDPPFQTLPRQIFDIAFRPDGRGYVLGVVDAGSPDITEIDATGVKLPTVAAVVAAVPAPDRIRFDGYPPRVYVGESSGTSNQYGVSNATTQPTGAVAITLSSANGPRSFAFMQNGPVVTGVWPSGIVTNVSPAYVDLVGARFDPASIIQFYNSSGIPTAPPKTFISTERYRVDVAGLPVGQYEVRVTNPGAQPLLFRLVDYFLSINPAAPAPPYPAFTMPTPSRSDGYRMRSFPQYATAGELLGAIAARFGGYNPSLVRVFLYEGGYVELNQVDPRMDIAGRAFWIMTRNGGDLSLDRPPVGLSLAGIPVPDKVVILRPGWNLLAMPTVGGLTDVRMAMADVSTFLVGDLTGGSVNLETLAATGTLSFPIRIVGGSYVPLAAGDDLYAGTGYWIRNNSFDSVYLVFNRTDAVPDNRPPGDVWTQYRSAGGQSASALEPPPPPGADLASDEGGSGCGTTGAELLLLLALLRRRRLRA